MVGAPLWTVPHFDALSMLNVHRYAESLRWVAANVSKRDIKNNGGITTVSGSPSALIIQPGNSQGEGNPYAREFGQAVSPSRVEGETKVYHCLEADLLRYFDRSPVIRAIL